MCSLKDLANDIRNNPKIFPNTDEIVNSIEELNCIIGHNKLKESMCDQISYIIGRKMNRKSGDLPMLNTVLYGPPGVGKSTVGEIIAKIWHALDVIEKPNYKNFEVKENINKIPQIKTFRPNLLYIFIIFFLFLMPILILLIFVYYFFGLNGLYVGFSLILFLVLFLYFYPSSTTNNVVQGQEGEKIQEIVKDNKSEVIFNIARREDFIGKYMGHSEDNTIRILKESLGGVLFVDEAYSLVTDPRDTYGIQCINIINQFLTENKGKIIVIFAGYKEKLYEGIFKYQPGLLRRFIWHMECEGYKPNELFKIFKYQIRKKKLSIRDENSARELFNKYEGCFPNYGGDTENVAFFTELKNYKDVIKGTCEIGVFETDQIEFGIKRMLENNPRKNQKQNNNNAIEKLLDNFDTSLFQDEDILKRINSC